MAVIVRKSVFFGIFGVKRCHRKLIYSSGGATPGRARSNDLARRSTALDPSPGSALPIALLCFGNSVNRKQKKTILCFEGDN